MARHDIVVIGASVGGVEALQVLVGGLPSDFPAAVFIVLHTGAHGHTLLPALLTRAGPLIAAHANHGEPNAHQRIYVAPPDAHLLVAHGHMQLGDGPKERYTRPAVDPLFRSAAGVYGPRVVGVLLSGNLADGTAGLMAIKQAGGIAIVQDPGEAQFPGMPRHALTHVAVDYCLPLLLIAPLLVHLAYDR
jgi:two-component system, chemotaxis family, protein-glutamate methylesterase/glutaminase